MSTPKDVPIVPKAIVIDIREAVRRRMTEAKPVKEAVATPITSTEESSVGMSATREDVLNRRARRSLSNSNGQSRSRSF